MRGKIFLLVVIIASAVLLTQCDTAQASEVAMLRQQNATLEEDLEKAKIKLALISATQDSLFNYADQRISDLEGEVFRLNNDLEGLLSRINDDIIDNIDSVYARVKRNYDLLKN